MKEGHRVPEVGKYITIEELQDRVWKENQSWVSQSGLYRAWSSVVGKHGLDMNSDVMAT